MDNYYVYAYLRISGTPYYVGKGYGSRAFIEHRNKKNNSGVHTPKDKSRIVFPETNLSEIGALALERRMIRWYGRKDNKTGILHNRTDGGEGTFGRKDSEITKKKKSEGRRGCRATDYTRNLIKEARAKQVPIVWTDKMRENMSKNTCFRKNKGKSVVEIYGIDKAAGIKKKQADAQQKFRSVPENETKRKMAHKLTWVKKMSTTYIKIFSLLDQGKRQFEILSELDVSRDTVRKAISNRIEIELLLGKTE